MFNYGISISTSYDLVFQAEAGLGNFYGMGGINISHSQAEYVGYILCTGYHELVINIYVFIDKLCGRVELFIRFQAYQLG